MATVIQVTAPLVIVRDEAGAQHYFYDGAILPAGLDGDHVKQLLDDGLVTKTDAEAADNDGPKAGTAEAILAEVGDDKAKAQAALDAENAKDKPRKGLVADLEKVLAA